MTIASIIIPACNESRVIKRLLSRLVCSARDGEFEIIVVANGCTDDTAEIACSFGPQVQVLSLPAASKQAALAAGDRAATIFPRVYVDADVELGADDVRALAAELQYPGTLAAAPRLHLAMNAVPRLLRWYWDVWTRLPEVRNGLFGRGVIAVSETGHQRLVKLPKVIADDLIASLAFSPAERTVVHDACVVVYPPRTFRDLIRIRLRAATGARQVEQTMGTGSLTARTRLSDLAAIAYDSPRMLPRVGLFLLVAVLVRWMRRRHRGGDARWLRDESSRCALPPRERAEEPPPRVRLGRIDLDSLSEAEVVEHVIGASETGCGGWIATPNVDICRRAERDPAAYALLAKASLRVPDGMPLIWAARLSGQSLPERVSGSSLIFSLTAAAAASGRSIYLLGGEPGVPESAAAELCRCYPGLKVTGTAAPPLGFDKDPAKLAEVRDRLSIAAPDIVYVGLGFPKQERLISELVSVLPQAWFVGCGASIAFAAGSLPRAPLWMRNSGMEWMFRLLTEPRRLARRYLVEDMPYAVQLLTSCMIARIRQESCR